MKVADILRLTFGIMLLLGAAANTAIVLTRPELYTGFADLTFLDLYRDLWASLVLPSLELWLVLVILFEFLTGALILSQGVWARLGLLAALLFFLFLIPFWWMGGALINVLFAAVVAWLLRFEYDRSLLDILRRTSA